MAQVKKVGFILILLIGTCFCDLGILVKNMIENFGNEVTNFHISNIQEISEKVGFGGFKVTGINIENIMNTVDYEAWDDVYTFTINIPNLKATIEFNDRYFNPDLFITKLKMKFQISRDLKRCQSVNLSWENINMDVGLISSLVPNSFLNNEYMSSLLKSFEPYMKQKITTMLHISPFSYLIERGSIDLHLKKNHRPLFNARDEL